MKVALEKVFPLAASPDAAWAVLQDIETVAGCMPGAKITERIDATHYKGTITVRVGPATLAFKGDIEVIELDTAARTLHLVGKGSDSTGTSAASMDLTAGVRDAASGCELTGRSEASVSGKAATFGGRMMNAVADQLLNQFAANFGARAAAVPAAQAPATAEAAPAQPGAAQGPPIVPPGVPSPAPPPPNELNGLALLWAILRDWVRGLFSRTT